MKKIYLAGGCFWGVEHYFSLIDAVVDTKVGYANSNVYNPTYKDVCEGLSNASETVMVVYDESKISLDKILDYFHEIIDPTSINKQGEDEGRQYRTGIYYVDDDDFSIIDNYIIELSKKYKNKIMIEVMKLENFHEAEEYHQKYLFKNPNGYCHIPANKFKELKDKEY